ncbi:MAG: hypothetical protein K6E18_00575 [Lachnospiraceae bacterium]|nr:hypothetical protein [Lachnospiraceae bacterium]
MNLFSETAGLAEGIVQIKYVIAVFFCGLVKLFSGIFDVLAGLMPVYDKGKETKLVTVFFANRGVMLVYWCMALIGIVMAVALAISTIWHARAEGKEKSKVFVRGVWLNVLRSVLAMLGLTLAVTFLLHYAALLLGQVGFEIWNDSNETATSERTFTEEELAKMARIYALIGNYAAAESYQNAYNLNACYNEIRPLLEQLNQEKVFDFRYPLTGEEGFVEQTWQNTLSRIVLAADLSKDVAIDEKNESLQGAILSAMDAVRGYNGEFHPLKSYTESGLGDYEKDGAMYLDSLCFLSGTLDAAINPQYNREPGMTDPLRGRFYLNSEKSMFSVYRAADVAACFHPEKIDYLIIILAALLLSAILFFIVAGCFWGILNLLLLYLLAPTYFASWPRDNGTRARQWLTAFLIQSISLFCMVLLVRIVQIFVPALITMPITVFGAENSSIGWLAKLALLLLAFALAGKLGRMIANALAKSAGMQAIRLQSPLFESVQAFSAGFFRRKSTGSSEHTGISRKRRIAAAPLYQVLQESLRIEEGAQKQPQKAWKVEAEQEQQTGKAALRNEPKMTDSAEHVRPPEISKGQILIHNKVRNKVPLPQSSSAADKKS